MKKLFPKLLIGGAALGLGYWWWKRSTHVTYFATQPMRAPTYLPEMAAQQHVLTVDPGMAAATAQGNSLMNTVRTLSNNYTVKPGDRQFLNGIPSRYVR